MFVNHIERLGLTEKEARVYLTSLRLGPLSMQVLAARSKIDRGTAYHVAKTLGEKGLFGQIATGKRPTFGITNPDVLLQRITDKKRETDAQYEAVQAMITDLRDLYQTSKSLN
jgi:sugar-specific transcriptional regulator TrmB